MILGTKSPFTHQTQIDRSKPNYFIKNGKESGGKGVSMSNVECMRTRVKEQGEERRFPREMEREMCNDDLEKVSLSHHLLKRISVQTNITFFFLKQLY